VASATRLFFYRLIIMVILSSKFSDQDWFQGGNRDLLGIIRFQAMI